MLSNPPPSLTSPPWSGRTKRTIVFISMGLLLFLALQLLQAWTIVIVATILSYLLTPIVNFFERRVLYRIPFVTVRRSLAVFFTFVVLILVIVLTIILIVPPLASQTQDFLEELPDLATNYEQRIEERLSRPITIGNRTFIPWDELQSLTGGSGEGTDSQSNEFDIVGAVREAATALSAPVVNIATIAVSFLFNVLFMLVIMFYLMRDGHTFIQKIDDFVPIEYQGDARRLIYELGLIWNAYLRGQLLLGLTVGVVTGLAAMVLGLPQPLVLGLLAGLLEFIPNLGPILSSIPAILFALISPSTTIPGLEGLFFALIVAVTYTLIQQLEALFLVPRVMGYNLDLHPVAILIAVLSGAAIAGILGIVLAAPVLATLRLLLIYVWGKLLDFDPFSDAPLESLARQREAALSPTHAPALGSPLYPEQSGEIVDD